MLLVFLLLELFLFNQNSRARETRDANVKNFSLQLVQVIFRHGQRFPSKNEAAYLDIKNSSIYGSEFGSLTKEGMTQEYALGKLLKTKYDDYLGVYEEKKVVARSTITPRTQMSLQLVLAGLFPPALNERFNASLNWQPIAYTAVAKDLDFLLAPHQTSQYKDLYKKTIKNSKDYQNIISNYTELLESLEKLTGKSYFHNILYTAGETYYLLKIHKLLNKTLPNWYNDQLFENLEDLFLYTLDAMSLTQELKKLNGGTLVRQVIENIEDKNEEPIGTKIYLYSTHDLTLGAFTRAQNLIVNAFAIPPFGSAYIIESYKDSQEKDYIRILSWDGKSDSFVQLDIKNCENLCTLEKYKSLVQNIIPTDEELQIYNSSNIVALFDCSMTLIVIFSTIIIALLIILTVITFKKLI